MEGQIFKHRNCILERTPSDTIPEMVTITKTPKLRYLFSISPEKASWQ